MHHHRRPCYNLPMAQDRYSAVWVSNSSISDFLQCPRLYYLRNMYKDPVTRHKISIVNPSLALGQAVHEVLEALSVIPVEERFSISLITKYEEIWGKFAGKSGGFTTEEEERSVKERGKRMLSLVMENPGPLKNKAIKLKQELPNYYLSEKENIILCGKIDWLEYIPEDDSLTIIDFKTGKNDESATSLQLPIYLLLVTELQKRKVSGASYWYLDRDEKPASVQLPIREAAYEKVLMQALKVKAARAKGEFLCPRGGCFACRPFEKVINHQADFVGVGSYNQDLYMLRRDEDPI